MYKFQTSLVYNNRKKIIDSCFLEIVSYGIENDGKEKIYFQWNVVLNRQEVKQLLDLMQEAHSLIGKKANV